MLIAIDRHVDLPFRSTYLSRVALHHCWSFLDSLLNRNYCLHHRGWLLFCCLLLILHTSQHVITRPIAVVRNTFTAHFIRQPVQPLHLLNSMVVGGIDRLADTGVRIALNCGLHTHMLLWRQIIRCHKVVWRWLVRVLISPFLEQRMIKNMLTCTVTTHHRKVIYRLNTRTHSCQQTCRPCWSLCE